MSAGLSAPQAVPVHGHVRDPVEGILHPPMRSRTPQERLRTGLPAHEEAAGPVALFPLTCRVAVIGRAACRPGR